jgi:phosphatidate cytidylyltransferase
VSAPSSAPQQPADAPPPAEKPEGGDLRARLLTASVLVPIVLYVVYLGGLPMLAAVILLTVLAQREFYGLIEDKGAHPIHGFGLAAGAALPVVAYLGNEYHATMLLTATLLVVMLAQLGRRQISEALANISGTFFGVFYVGWLLSHAVVLRQFYEQVVIREGTIRATTLGFVPESGVFLLIFALAVVVLCDAGAYFAGRAYGVRKLAPRVSPTKTVEGTVGGVLAGTCGGLLTKGIFDLLWPDLSQGLGWPAAAVFGIAVSGLAVVGDLVESLLKRDAQVKDAGSVLPGMGGVLDRVDSPLLGIPGMYYMMLFYLFLRVH